MELCLLVLDQVFSGIVVAPLTVFYWRGTWVLLDIAFTDHPYLGAWFSVFVGNIGMTTAAFLQHFLNHKLKKKNIFSWVIGFHIYTYAVSFFNVNLWRGIWVCLNEYTGTGPKTYANSLGIGFGLMLMTRTTKNCVAPPLLVGMDVDQQSFFGYTTRFETFDKKPWSLENYILDTLFTSLCVHNWVVLYWRGLWGLFDNFLYPDNLEHSAWANLIIGYVVFVLLLPWQLICNKIYKKCLRKDVPSGCGWFGRVSADVLLCLVANFCAVSIWRGFWLTADLYILPEKMVESCWLTHAVGMFGLMLFLCANSIIVKGCGVDGEGDGRGNCLPPNRYLRYLILDAKRETQFEDVANDEQEKYPEPSNNGVFQRESTRI